jgi:hypothetical protein
MLFADRLRFDSFTRWILDLAAKYPALRFEIGIHIHLQWIDSYWWQYHSWLIPRLGEFSRLHRLPWGICEFSIYDRLWKPRIACGGVTPQRVRSIDRIEGILPDAPSARYCCPSGVFASSCCCRMWRYFCC